MRQYFEYRPPRESAFVRPHCRFIGLRAGEYFQRMDYDARWWAGELSDVVEAQPLTQPPRLKPTRVRRKRRKPKQGFSVS